MLLLVIYLKRIFLRIKIPIKMFIFIIIKTTNLFFSLKIKPQFSWFVVSKLVFDMMNKQMVYFLSTHSLPKNAQKWFRPILNSIEYFIPRKASQKGLVIQSGPPFLSIGIHEEKIWILACLSHFVAWRVFFVWLTWTEVSSQSNHRSIGEEIIITESRNMWV